jgi:hypothetical protein
MYTGRVNQESIELREYWVPVNLENFPSSHVDIHVRNDLAAVLYELESYSLTLREEHRVRVFQDRVQRRIFGPKWEEVVGCWRKPKNSLFHNLYCFSDIITTMQLRTL